MAFTYRSVKGSLLTAEEVDANFLEVETLHDATEGFKENAETSALNASASKDKAQEWAENPKDVEVEAGQYSAKHYSIKASEFTGPWETWQGDWVAGSYTALDGVTHNGSSFIANKNTSEEPSLSAADWDLLAGKGDQGDQGIQGEQGIQGDQGIQGEQGDPWNQWQGDWVAGAYSYLDAVQHNGSSWVANKNTSEEPSISAVDWDLLAEKGTDGTGTGDVKGPISGVTNNFTSFADATGKNIKDSGKNASDFEDAGAAATVQGNLNDHTNNTTDAHGIDGKVNTDDPRLSDSRPASDVSAWAKAASKPAYTSTDVGLGNVPNEDATDPANWNTAKTDGNFLVGNGTTYVAESGATARASMGAIAATNYATSTVGGTVKCRLNGTTAYFTIDGTSA
ncbi:MAG: hypothetical protein RBR45_14125 [Pseudomonas sp.]|nr:hypothetical protein [Pseudomonas sp.]